MCRRIQSPLANELTTLGNSLLKELSRLRNDADNAWKQSTWDRLTEQVDQQVGAEYGFDAGFFGFHVKLKGTEHGAMVSDGHGIHAVLFTFVEQVT